VNGLNGLNGLNGVSMTPLLPTWFQRSLNVYLPATAITQPVTLATEAAIAAVPPPPSPVTK
jgi:hypothetical protein